MRSSWLLTPAAVLRKLVGLSIEQVAVLLDCSRSTVASMESGRSKVSEKSADLYVTQFGISYEWITGDDPDSPPMARNGESYSRAIFDLAQARKKIAWVESETGSFDAWVPVLNAPPKADDYGEESRYHLWINPRPWYCDRGDWSMHVDAEGTARLCLDEQDGFPRYFFGSAEEVKEQFTRWVNKRKEI